MAMLFAATYPERRARWCVPNFRALPNLRADRRQSRQLRQQLDDIWEPAPASDLCAEPTIRDRGIMGALRASQRSPSAVAALLRMDRRSTCGLCVRNSVPPS